MEPGGNSGLYVWTNAELSPRGLPKGIEIQILDLDWVRLNTREGSPPPPIAYVHGEFIAVNGMKFVPDNPRGERSMALENRARGRGEWNQLHRCRHRRRDQARGERQVRQRHRPRDAEEELSGAAIRSAEIHFRNIKILELPSGVTSPEQTAPDLPWSAARTRPTLERRMARHSGISFCWVGTGSSKARHALRYKRRNQELEPDVALDRARVLPRRWHAPEPAFCGFTRAWFNEPSALNWLFTIVTGSFGLLSVSVVPAVCRFADDDAWFGALNASTRSCRSRRLPPTRMFRCSDRSSALCGKHPTR